MVISPDGPQKERDGKLAEMIAVLTRYRIIAISVSYSDLNKILARPTGPMKNPYALVFAHIVLWMLDSGVKRPAREKLELTFDQGVIGRERNIKAAYAGLMSHLPDR